MLLNFQRTAWDCCRIGLRALSQLVQKVGAVTFNMRGMVDDQSRIVKPDGGVVKNYDCATRYVGNAKPVVRPGTKNNDVTILRFASVESVHATLYSTAHYAALNNKFEVLRASRRHGAFLFHFSVRPPPHPYPNVY